MTPRDRELVNYLKHHHFSADIIAESMKVNVEEICEILGWAKDKKGRDVAHKDYNYYEFGVEHKMEYYGLFLQEGDFEKYQPVCYMDHDSKEFNRIYDEARSIPETDDDRSEARRFWILMRFQPYQNTEWGVYRDRFLDHANMCDDINIRRRKAVVKPSDAIRDECRKRIQDELKSC